MNVLGEGYRFEFSSADATTIGAGKVYDRDGTERVLASDEVLVLWGLSGYAADAAGQVDVVTDHDDDGAIDAGDRLLSFEQAGGLNGGPNGLPCQAGKAPKVKAAAAGNVVVTGACSIARKFSAAVNV